jgi:hypothetical protein
VGVSARHTELKSPRTARRQIPEGRRNSTLTRIAGSFRRIGLSAAEIGRGLAAINDLRCRPPLDEREVARIAESVARYEAGPPWLLDPAGFYSGTDGIDQLVLRLLVDFANYRGECFPSVRTLAARAGVAPNTIVAAVARLEALGRIEVQRSARGARLAVNRYRMIWPLRDGSAAETELRPAEKYLAYYH